MLIVISNPTAVKDEAQIINALFHEGLEIFHLRKPTANINDIKTMLEKIDSKYHLQIALHQQHQIVNDYGIKRLHFTEAKRIETDEATFAVLKENKNILSTSFHQLEVYSKLSPAFEYAFFGPVFNSISKQGYTSIWPDGFVFPVKPNLPKVIALAGVNATNMEQVKQMKFSGAAVLGAIWQQPNECIKQFITLQKAWKHTDPLY